MKKFAIIILLSLVLILFFAAIAWFKGIPTAQVNNSSLEISSLGGNMKVFIDGVLKGEVKESQTKQDFFNLTPGIHKVKLVRSDATTPYFDYETTVNLVNNLSSSINYELGPTIDSTQGWVLDFTPKTTKDNLLYIYTSENPDIKVLDSSKNELSSESSLSANGYKVYKITLDQTYTVTISKSQYITQTFNVIEGSSSTEFENYDIVIRSKLFAVPILLDK